MNSIRRLIVPLAGILVTLLAWLAQNVWHLFDIDEITTALRNLSWSAMVLTLFLFGMAEATIIICFCLPGTAIVTLLLLGLQPTWTEGLGLLISLMAGTLTGYSISRACGQALGVRLPSAVGQTNFSRMSAFMGRYGAAAFAAAAFHPNPLALAFSILGYFQARQVRIYFVTAALGQAGWWAFYASTANVVARQNVVTGSNFQLFLAGLFLVWLVYELLLVSDNKN